MGHSDFESVIGFERRRGGSAPPGSRKNAPPSIKRQATRFRASGDDCGRGSAGLPVGVQVAARHWREDMVPAAMAVIETAAQQAAGFPNTPLLPVRLCCPSIDTRDDTHR